MNLKPLVLVPLYILLFFIASNIDIEPNIPLEIFVVGSFACCSYVLFEKKKRNIFFIGLPAIFLVLLLVLFYVSTINIGGPIEDYKADLDCSQSSNPIAWTLPENYIHMCMSMHLSFDGLFGIIIGYLLTTYRAL